MKKFLIFALMILGTAGFAWADATFTVVAEGWATGVSDLTPHGEFAAGIDYGKAFRWSEATGLEYLTPEEWQWTHTVGISDDGTQVASSVEYGDRVFGPARWTEGMGWENLDTLYPDPPYHGGSDWSFGSGYDISGDGSIVCGLAWHPGYRASGFQWTETDGIMAMDRPLDRSSRASAISGDGSTIVGFFEHEQYGQRRPVRWANGDPTADLFLGAETWGEANGVSSDGSVIVGDVGFMDDPSYIMSLAFTYSDEEGFRNIGIFPWQDPWWDRSSATAVSDNGIVVGWTGDMGPWGVLVPFVWTECGGLQRATDYLTDMGVVIPDNIEILTVQTISADGRTMGGQAINWDTWFTAGWVATYDLPAQLPLDIKPGSCPNPMNVKAIGKLPVAILGTEALDVMNIDPASITISRADCVTGDAGPNVKPNGLLHVSYEDVGTPYDGDDSCGCHEMLGDGYMDLQIKFNTQDLVSALALDTLANDTEMELVVSGTFLDGMSFEDGGEFEARDCILIKGNDSSSMSK